MSKRKKGFSLIELVVVIGILGILMATLLAVVGGSDESARAAKCMANMRSLSAAVQSRAMESEYYCLAGSRQVAVLNTKVSDIHIYYAEIVGWISWLSNKEQFKKKPSSPPSVDTCPFYGTENEEDAMYAITNGAIWRAVGENRDVYVCPEHLRYRQEKGKKTPKWSYVMNARFGYDTTQGSGAVGTSVKPGVIGYGNLARADRVLLFAELPTVKFKDGKPIDNPDGDEWQCDCVLNYKANVDGDSYGKDWDGEAEAIGFNHKNGKRGRCGHVTFADGHAEKLVYASNGLTPEELTALLCAGKDVAFDGRQWKKVDNQD